MKKSKNKSYNGKLRKKAEEFLNKTSSKIKKIPSQDINYLVEELQIHQVELEMQNEELRLSQMELEASRDKYSDLYDFTPVGYLSISNKGTIQETHFAGAAMLGVERGILIGKPISQFINRDDQDIFYRHRKKLIETKNKQTCELRLIRNDGSQFYGQMDGFPVFEENGNLDHILVSVTDITDRKRAEENLKAEMEFSEKALNTQRDTFFAFNPATGKPIKWNNAFEEVSGYSSEEIAQMKAPDAYYSRQDLEKAAKAISLILENGSGTVELEFICRNGRKIPFEYVVSVMYNDLGQPENFISIGRDITRRKLAEVTLQTRTNTLAERVKELNCLYGISDLVSKPGVPLDEILQGVVDLIPPAWRYPEIVCSRIILGNKEFKTKDFRESVWKQAQNIMVRGKTLGTLEVYYLEERPEQDETPFLMEERLLIKAAAERLGKTIERRQAEEALQKAHNELERRVEERTAALMSANEKLNQEIEIRKQTETDLEESTQKIKLFAYSVSHDLKSPTISIYGLTKRLSRRYGNILDENRKEG